MSGRLSLGRKCGREEWPRGPVFGEVLGFTFYVLRFTYYVLDKRGSGYGGIGCCRRIACHAVGGQPSGRMPWVVMRGSWFGARGRVVTGDA